MAVSIIPPKFYAWDRNGKPLAFGKLYTYQARTNTPKPTYQSEDQVVENTNPVILNGEGYANVYLDGSYKMVLKDQNDNEIWSSDPVSASQPSEWVDCRIATYISPDSFSLDGNVTNTYETGRVVRIDNQLSSYSYSTIESSVFSSGSTQISLTEPVVKTSIDTVCRSIAGPNSRQTNSIIKFDNLSLVISSEILKFGDTINLKERYHQNGGGGGIWDVVYSEDVTTNGFNIVQLDNIDLAIVLRKENGFYNVKAFGCYGNGSDDDSGALLSALQQSTQLIFPKGTYPISFNTTSGNDSFHTYSNENGISLLGRDATIKDVSTYGVDFLTDIIKLVDCKNVYVEVNCDANELPDITAPYPNGIGYNGSSYLYLEGFCENIELNATLGNVRYGIRQGGYSNPALGGANNIKAKLKCFQVGYPVALYRASNIDLDIDSNIQHRAAYITGCSNVRGNITQAGFTYAVIGVLIADALTVAAGNDNDRRSYGGDNININVVDRGTTGTQSNRAAAGITAAWTAPDIAFNDIHVNLSVKCNNANRTLAGFRLENTVGWLPTNEYNNIKVSGVIDRRAQTLGASAWADVTIAGIESGEVGPYPNSPVFNGIDLDDLKVINGAVTGNLSRIEVPNAVGVISARRAKMGGASLLINAPDAIIDLTNAEFGSVSGAVYPTVQLGSSGYRVNSDGTIEQWMLVNYTATADTDQTFNFPVEFPNEAYAPNADIVGITGRTWSFNGLTKTGVTLRCTATGLSFYIKVTGH